MSGDWWKDPPAVDDHLSDMARFYLEDDPVFAECTCGVCELCEHTADDWLCRQPPPTCSRCGATGLRWEMTDAGWRLFQEFANGRSEMHRCNWTEAHERQAQRNPRNKAPVQRKRRA